MRAVLDLWLAAWTRWQQRQVLALAPADLLVRLALRRADLDRRSRQ